MIEDVASIARDAGRIIMEFYGSGALSVSLKEDRSPLTDADTAANRFICDALRSQFSIPVVSEESVVAYDERKNWNEFWLVDPLDGTKDFLAKNDEFTVNIALIRNTTPVLGVLYAPALDELFAAEKGKGSYVERGGGRERLPRTRCGGYVMARSRFHDSADVDEFARLNAITQSRKIGSAVKFGRLAEGAVNIYPRFSGSSEWDIAAGHLVATEAGCRIVDLGTMREPVYNKPSMRNNYFVVCSPKVDFENLRFPEVRK